MRRRVQQIVVAVLLAGSSTFIAATATSGSDESGGQVLRVPRDYPTIQAALDAAAEGDTVQVRAGTYNENVVVSTSGVRLRAQGGVVLDGAGLTGTGIHVRGASAAAPVDGVEDLALRGRELRARHHRAVGHQRPGASQRGAQQR